MTINYSSLHSSLQLIPIIQSTVPAHIVVQQLETLSSHPSSTSPSISLLYPISSRGEGEHTSSLGWWAIHFGYKSSHYTSFHQIYWLDMDTPFCLLLLPVQMAWNHWRRRWHTNTQLCSCDGTRWMLNDIAHDQFYQAFPRINPASDKCWARRRGYEANTLNNRTKHHY